MSTFLEEEAPEDGYIPNYMQALPEDHIPHNVASNVTVSTEPTLSFQAAPPMYQQHQPSTPTQLPPIGYFSSKQPLPARPAQAPPPMQPFRPNYMQHQPMHMHQMQPQYYQAPQEMMHLQPAAQRQPVYQQQMPTQTMSQEYYSYQQVRVFWA